MNDRHPTNSLAQSAVPPIQPQWNVPEWLSPDEPQPAAPHASEPEPHPSPANQAPSLTLDPNPSQLNPFIHPEPQSRVPDATRYTLDTVLNTNQALRLPLSSNNRPFARGR